MEFPSQEDIVQVLLDSRPISFSHLLGIPIEDASKESLFRLLCISLLYNEWVSMETLVRVSQMLEQRRWTSPENLAKSTETERVYALEVVDYVVFDEHENYAGLLGEAAERVLTRFNGDLRNLRKEAREQGDIERALIKEFKGVGDNQADIFFREAQVAWCESFPFLSNKARTGAEILGLTDVANELARKAGNLQFPRLVWALEQAERTGAFREIMNRVRELQTVR
jgi:hypothetical protein